MDIDTLVHLLKQTLWMSSVLMGPPLLVALVLGLVIGLIQALTSIQEQTLTFVPKVAGIVLIYIFLGAWMLRLLIDWSAELIGGLDRWGAM